MAKRLFDVETDSDLKLPPLRLKPPKPSLLPPAKDLLRVVQEQAPATDVNHDSPGKHKASCTLFEPPISDIRSSEQRHEAGLRPSASVQATTSAPPLSLPQSVHSQVQGSSADVSHRQEVQGAAFAFADYIMSKHHATAPRPALASHAVPSHSSFARPVHRASSGPYTRRSRHIGVESKHDAKRTFEPERLSHSTSSQTTNSARRDYEHASLLQLAQAATEAQAHQEADKQQSEVLNVDQQQQQREDQAGEQASHDDTAAPALSGSKPAPVRPSRKAKEQATSAGKVGDSGKRQTRQSTGAALHQVKSRQMDEGHENAEADVESASNASDDYADDDDDDDDMDDENDEDDEGDSSYGESTKARKRPTGNRKHVRTRSAAAAPSSPGGSTKRTSRKARSTRARSASSSLGTTTFNLTPSSMLAEGLWTVRPGERRRRGEAPFPGTNVPGLPTEEQFSQMPSKRARGRLPPTPDELGLPANRDPNQIAEPTEEHYEYAGQTKTGKPRKIFVCKAPGCQKVFRRLEHLKRHVRSLHTFEKPYICRWPDCGRQFARHDNCAQHLRTHQRKGQSAADFAAEVRQVYQEYMEDAPAHLSWREQ